MSAVYCLKEAKKCFVGYDTWRMAKSSATLARTVVDPRLFMVVVVVVVDVEKIVGSVRRPSCNLAGAVQRSDLLVWKMCKPAGTEREREIERKVAKKSLV